MEARPHAVVSRQGADLFERVRSGSDHFTPSFRKVAEYVISHPHEVAFLPAAKVAAGTQVSESVVVRFAGALGYAGYPAMQQAAQAFVRSQLSPSQRFESLRITRSSPSADIFRSVVLQDIGNLRATVEHAANQNTFGPVVDALLQAHRVYVIGIRGLGHLAGLLGFLLDMAGYETVLITQGDATAFQAARRVGKGDALVAFAFARYTKATVQLVELARRRDAATIVICDSIMARAARAADYALQTATATSSFHNSYAGAVACINAIVVAISTKMRARVAQTLKDVDAILPDDYFDFT